MANTPPFSFDQVGIWSELKLDIVEKYGSAYTGAFANEPRLKKFYVDAFSGAGVHISSSMLKNLEIMDFLVLVALSIKFQVVVLAA
jgi:phosphomannomutase